MRAGDDARPETGQLRALGAEQGLLAQIVGDEPGPSCREEPRGRHAAAGEPHDEDGLPGELRSRPRHAALRGGRIERSNLMRADAHLSFSVARLSIEKIRARIQKRITTFVSSQPDSSKW